MRHRVDHRKLGRTNSHRRAMLRNMVTSLFDAERITTTDAKAKEARRLAERLITRAKKGFTAHSEGNKGVALAHWRQAARVVQDTDILRKLFEEIAPHYMERNGGYTRIVRLGTRLGDNAREVLLELVDTAVTVKPKMEGAAEEGGEDKAKKEAAPKRKAKAKAKGKDEAAAEEKSKAARKAKAKAKSKAKTKTKSKTKAEPKAKTKSKSTKAKPKGKSKAKG